MHSILVQVLVLNGHILSVLLSVCMQPVTKHITVAMDDQEAAQELARSLGVQVEEATPKQEDALDSPKSLARELHRYDAALLLIRIRHAGDGLNANARLARLK